MTDIKPALQKARAFSEYIWKLLEIFEEENYQGENSVAPTTK